MQLDRQAQFAGALEHPLDLGRREGQVLAEGVDRIDQAFGRQGRQHLATHQVDVVVGTPGILRRQRMGGQAGGAHGHRQALAEAADHPQHLALAGQVEAVAGLDLHRGHALAQQTAQALRGRGQQLLLAGGPGGAHGAGDPPAGGGDLGVADALQPLLELGAAVTAEHQVGVAVDQPGRQPLAAKVKGLGIVARRQLGARAYPGDVLPRGDQCGIFDDRILPAGHGGGMTVEPEALHRVRFSSRCMAANRRPEMRRRPQASLMRGLRAPERDQPWDGNSCAGSRSLRQRDAISSLAASMSGAKKRSSL